MKLENFTIKTLRKKFKKREISVKEVVKAYFDRIEKEDKKIGAFLTLTKNLAFLQAEKLDKNFKDLEKKLPLFGIPIGVKDNILVKDVRCTAGSRILENFIAPYDATVVKKLKEKGCVILGKTNLDEFAMGSSGENSAFFPTRNPHDLERVAGGSSSGSAAAVSANFCVFSLGSDTAGSIRLPASFCGVVGLKPTYGTVSRYGLIAMASSLDQIGPLTKTVEDAQLVFDIISGRDLLDSTSVKEYFYKKKNLKKELKKIKIGIPKEFFKTKLNKKIEEIIEKALKNFEKKGVKIKEISIPHSTDHALAAYYIIMPSEVSANLARYDGIKYGKSILEDEEVENLIDVYFNTRAKYLGKEVKRRIMLGTFSLSSGYYEAYYLRAKKVQRVIKEEFEKAFQEVDVLITPTSPQPAFKLGEKVKDPLSMYLSDIFMVGVNLAGLCALSVPYGRIGKLPIGVQIIGPPFSEKVILELGKFLEKTR